SSDVCSSDLRPSLEDHHPAEGGPAVDLDDRIRPAFVQRSQKSSVSLDYQLLEGRLLGVVEADHDKAAVPWLCVGVDEYQVSVSKARLHALALHAQHEGARAAASNAGQPFLSVGARRVLDHLCPVAGLHPRNQG